MNEIKVPWKWVHAGPGSDRADWDHKARNDGQIVPHCRSCGSKIEKAAR